MISDNFWHRSNAPFTNDFNIKWWFKNYSWKIWTFFKWTLIDRYNWWWNVDSFEWNVVTKRMMFYSCDCWWKWFASLKINFFNRGNSRWNYHFSKWMTFTECWLTNTSNWWWNCDFFNDEHPKNAYASIISTVDGIDILINDLQS